MKEKGEKKKKKIFHGWMIGIDLSWSLTQQPADEMVFEERRKNCISWVFFIHIHIHIQIYIYIYDIHTDIHIHI
mgnify:CR=1 FL=1